MPRNDAERVIQALNAIQLIRDTYASSVEGCRRIEDVIEMLRMTDRYSGTVNGLCENVANALEKTYLRSPAQAA